MDSERQVVSTHLQIHSGGVVPEADVQYYANGKFVCVEINVGTAMVTIFGRHGVPAEDQLRDFEELGIQIAASACKVGKQLKLLAKREKQAQAEEQAEEVSGE